MLGDQWQSLKVGKGAHIARLDAVFDEKRGIGWHVAGDGLKELQGPRLRASLVAGAGQ